MLTEFLILFYLQHFFTMSSSSTFSQPAFGPSIRWGILSAGKISADFVKAISITEGAGKDHDCGVVERYHITTSFSI